MLKWQIGPVRPQEYNAEALVSKRPHERMLPGAFVEHFVAVPQERRSAQSLGEDISVHVGSLHVGDGNAFALHLLTNIVVSHIDMLSSCAVRRVVSLRDASFAIAEEMDWRDVPFKLLAQTFVKCAFTGTHCTGDILRVIG